MRLKSAAVCFLAACAVVCSAQQQQLDNQSIVRMHDAGMSNNLILTAINTQAGTYNITTDGMIALKRAGIDDDVLQAMLLHASAQNVPPPPAAIADNTGGPPLTGPHKPRVFITSLGTGAGLLSLRNQSMEVSKDMERDCPAITMTLNQPNADYTVQLNHIEAGFFRDNQFQLADHNGDLVGTKIKGGASVASGVKRVCSAVLADWNAHNLPSAPTISAPASTPAQ